VAGRTESVDVLLNRELNDPDVARAFILNAAKEGLSLRSVLAEVISAMGITKFAARARMATTTVRRAIRPGAEPGLRTLDRLLAPFGLVVGVVSTRREPSRRRGPLAARRRNARPR
jgi:DNA-binding phage protein